MKIKKGDLVKVITGKEASKVPPAEQSPRRVMEVLEGGSLVVVEGVNLVYKHVKKGHPKSPQGGRLRLEMPIAGSNVRYFCEACRNLSGLAVRYQANGAKERYCRKCQASAGVLSPPRPAYAQK